MRKFNIGDKVVEFYYGNLYGNEFHYKEIIRTYKVSDANDDIFTIDGNKIDDSMRSHHPYHQSCGVQRCGGTVHRKLYHFEKDKDEYEAILKQWKDEFLAEEQENIQKEIEHCKNQISYFQNRIQKLQTNQYGVKYGSTIYDLNEYIDKVDKHIENTLKK